MRPSAGPWPRSSSIRRPDRKPRRPCGWCSCDSARQLAVDLADADLLRRSVEAAASQFQIDVGPMRKDAFAEAAAAARTPAAAGQFAEACLGLVDGAVAAEDFDAAMDYGHAAYGAAGKARDKALVDNVVARGTPGRRPAEAVPTGAGGSGETGG